MTLTSLCFLVVLLSSSTRYPLPTPKLPCPRPVTVGQNPALPIENSIPQRFNQVSNTATSGSICLRFTHYGVTGREAMPQRPIAFVINAGRPALAEAYKQARRPAAQTQQPHSSTQSSTNTRRQSRRPAVACTRHTHHHMAEQKAALRCASYADPTGPAHAQRPALA